MKKRLLMLLSLYMAITSVGWLHAQDAKADGSITSEITVAERGKPIVFGITTKKGSVPDNTMVRVSLQADGDAFKYWESFYYEPNGSKPGWVKWNSNNDAFGPAGGFPFMDATSYIKVIPTTADEFTYTLNVTKVGEEVPFITKKCTLVVKEGPVSPIASIGDTQYASLATAVHFAKADETIRLTAGHFNLVPGTELVEGQAGWYLPITQKGLTIEGVKGEGVNQTFVESDVKTINGAWASQNFITVFADGVTLKNMIVDCKKESNKAIEVIAKDFRMFDVQVGIFVEGASGFGGSVYFNKSDVGTVTIENCQLVKSRITFSGAQTGNVVLNKVGIGYENVVIDATNMGQLQEYGPFGATAGKTGLNITATDLNVFMSAVGNTYKLDANTIANLPAGATLNLKAGTYTADLTLDKAITINGAGSNESGTKIVGKMNITATDKAKVELSGLHLTPDNVNNHAIVVGTEYGQQNPVISLIGCRISKSKRGINILGKGAEVSLDNPDIDANYYGVSLCNEQQKLSINGGTVQGWAAIMTAAGGLDADKQTGKLASTGTVISVSKSKLVSKLISNENYGVVVLQEKYNGVTLTIDNSELTAMPNQSLELKYSSVLDIRSYGNKVAVTNSKLSCEGGMNEAGGGVVSLGWSHADFGKENDTNTHFSDVKDYSVPTANTITISSSEVKMKAGEKSVVTQRIANNQPLDKLSINGVNYTVQAGNVYRCYQVGFINNDWFMVDDNKNPLASDVASLKELLKSATDGSTITLLPGVYQFGEQLTIDKSITLAGTDTTTVFEATSEWPGNLTNAEKYLLNITTNNVSLKNLVVQKSQLGGINVYKATGVTLDNVISRNNKAAGLTVNGSEVKATNFRTSGNGWYGVNVDKGDKVQSEPVFTIGSGCSFGEKVAIVSDIENAPASYVIGSGWFKTTQEGNGKKVSIWFNGATTGLDFAITSVPSSVIYGQANLPLLTNVDKAYYEAEKGVKISILGDKKEIVEIKTAEGQPDSLIIHKPGEAVLVLAVGDTTVTQPLTVLKKTLTITGITTEKARDYDGKTEVTLNTTDMKVDGLVGVNQEDVVTPPTEGEALSANAGLQPVKVTATLKDNYNEYYELAEITGVIDTIKKVELEVKATVTGTSTDKDTSVVDYGTLPTFGVEYSGFVNSEDASTDGVLSGALKYNCSATTTSLAGTYSVTPSGYTATNYDIKYVSAPFKIKAINPTVEITGVEVISLGTAGENNASVKVTARITSNGGTKMEDLKGLFKVINNRPYEIPVSVKKDGTFSTTLQGLASIETSIQATTDQPGSWSEVIVNLSLKLQNVSFATTFSTLTYGIDPISLTAKDFEEGAKITFTSSDPSILAIEENKMSVVKPGVATITVTATKEGHITAIAKQTITVKKKALAVTPDAITKKYDGTTNVKVTGKLPELEGLQAASLDAATLDAHFANKNVGTSSVKLAGEFALSAGGDYYELVQPTNLTGTITSGGNVTVEVSNVTRNYNEKALRYDLKVLADGKELASSEYTGTVSVSESLNGTYNVSVNDVKAPNYGTVNANPASGNVTIKKGTPKVLTYNAGNGEVAGLLLDKEGWSDAEVKVINEDGGKAHATVIYNEGKDSIVGKSLVNATPPTIEWNFNVLMSMMKATKAVTTQSVQYGQTATFNKMENVSFESSNPNVFVVKEGTNGNMMIETIGVGTAAIIAKGTGSNAGVTCLQVTVNPKPITLTANTIEKVYDGMTTAHVTLTPSEELVGASIDLTGVSFNFAHSNVGDNITVSPSKEIVLKNNDDVLASAANYTIDALKLKGKITQRELTFTGTEVNKFYDGTNTAELTDYSATGLIEGETVPALTATFKNANGNDDANVATGLKVTLAPKDGNYTLAPVTDLKGNIVKSTIDATLPEGASSDANLTANVALVVRETGKKVTPSQIGFTPIVSHEGSGSTTVYYISGGDNDNYSVVYNKNQIGFKAEQGGDGGSTTVSVSSVSLDKTELTLPRQDTYTLKATINPSDASDKSVTWKSSDETVATVDANGKVTALKVGKATITVTTVDGGKTASCVVTVDFATGLEEALANTQVYAKQGNIYVNPVQPLQLTIVNMIGKVVYNARISSYAQIPVAKGIYIVKLTNAGNTVVTKVNVY